MMRARLSTSAPETVSENRCCSSRFAFELKFPMAASALACDDRERESRSETNAWCPAAICSVAFSRAVCSFASVTAWTVVPRRSNSRSVTDRFTVRPRLTSGSRIEL